MHAASSARTRALSRIRSALLDQSFHPVAPVHLRLADRRMKPSRVAGRARKEFVAVDELDLRSQQLGQLLTPLLGAHELTPAPIDQKRRATRNLEHLHELPTLVVFVHRVAIDQTASERIRELTGRSREEDFLARELRHGALLRPEWIRPDPRDITHRALDSMPRVGPTSG